MLLWGFVGTDAQTRNRTHFLPSTNHAPHTLFCLSDHLGYPPSATFFFQEKGGGSKLLPDFPSLSLYSNNHAIITFQQLPLGFENSHLQPQF